MGGLTVSSIASGAFTGSNVKTVTIPDTVTSIAADAFDEGVTIVASPDSYAAQFAQENGFEFVSSEATEVLLGDINGDGEVNSVDALLALRYNAGTVTDLTAQQLFQGDVNSDNTVNSVDALEILEYNAGNAVADPVGEYVEYTAA